MHTHSPAELSTHDRIAELDRLGDEIAELAAHLDAATARLFDNPRVRRARGGWGNGFKSCAHWLSWRVGDGPGGGARARPCGAGFGWVAIVGPGAGPRGALVRQGAGPYTRSPTAETEEEPEVGALVVQALTAAREALYQKARHDQDGHLLEVGARTRTIPPALRRALQHRDRGYRFPGCSVRFGEGHHIRHVAHGGPTTLLNLTLLCRRHHRPDGRLLPEVPTPASVPSDPAHTLRAGHSARGISIHPRSSCPGWLGERLDVRWATDVLHPRALGESPDLGES